MPSKSNKQELKEFCFVLWGSSEIWGGGTEDEEVIEIFMWLLEVCRYTAERPKIPKSIDWIRTVLSDEQFGERRFRAQLRVDRQSFVVILGLIRDHEAFAGSQAPVPLQLAVAMYNFGTFGNSSSVGNIATKFGVSEGAVASFTTRVINALIAISPSWISWPNAHERKEISTTMTENLLPKCVGFVDGSSAVLYQAPKEDKEVYWSRKKHYSMQFQVICDQWKRIRHFYTGYPGSVHDAKVFGSTEISRDPSTYFTQGEYIIGDAAYTLTESVIVPFKRSQGTLDRKRSKFNTHVSGQRIRIEHCIGILKGRFQSLRGLRINVDKTEGHKRVCEWIEAVIILHNISAETDPWCNNEDELFLEDDDESDPDPGPADAAQQASGEKKRAALVEIINSLI